MMAVLLNPLRLAIRKVLVTISSVDFIFEIGKELGEGRRGRESLKK